MINISKSQQIAIDPPGNVLVSACPGSGKTRTLIARAIKKAGELPEYKKLALITYTNAATDEMNDRLPDIERVFIGTIHRFCLEFILKPFAWIYNWPRPKIMTFEQKRVFITINSGEFYLGNDPIGELEKIRRKQDGQYDYKLSWNNPDIMPLVTKKYQKYKEDLKVIDFNDVLYFSYLIVSKNDFICTSLANIFFEILVDEFQDTNIFQYEILNFIANKHKCTFFMVGDDRQAIMSFAGALPNAFKIVKGDFKPKERILTETYRSTYKIIKTYSAIFPNHPRLNSLAEHCYFNRPTEIRNCGEIECYCNCNNCLNDVELIKSILYSYIDNGLKENDIAILSPWRADCYKIALNLRQEFNFVGDGALPHKIAGIKDTTFDILKSLSIHQLTPSVKTLRSIRRCVNEHIDENGITPEISISRCTNDLISSFMSLNFEQNLQSGLSEIKELMDYYFDINHTTITEIKNRITRSNEDDWTLSKYLTVLSRTSGIVNDTIHSSKGLEFEGVIIVHADEGRIPHYRWDEEPTEEDIQNGQRLIYVGLSRARKYLSIVHGNNPSRFIKPLL